MGCYRLLINNCRLYFTPRNEGKRGKDRKLLRGDTHDSYSIDLPHVEERWAIWGRWSRDGILRRVLSWTRSRYEARVMTLLHSKALQVYATISHAIHQEYNTREDSER
jgi:hypothetical protein